jgi:hypothetical protein
MIKAGRIAITVAAGVASLGIMGASSCDSSSSGNSSGGSGSSTAPQSYTLTGANVRQAILANEEGNGDFGSFQVSIQGGTQVVFVDKITNFIDEQGLITAEAEDTLSVIKAIKSGFKGVTLIHVQMDTDFTDSNGNTSTEPAAWIEMTSDTFAPINADGLQLPIFSQPANLFAKADAYDIHPGIWKNISTDHRGTLTDPASGTPALTQIPS